jgi:Zn finger protein HypA/HybF involved in hydrogenase expression
MADRVKVIKGLEICVNRIPGKYDCNECPYEIDGNLCEINLTNDAIALLKKQEAVEPEVEVLNEIDRLYKCPKCHKYFWYEEQKYCDVCGQEVKWE